MVLIGHICKSTWAQSWEKLKWDHKHDHVSSAVIFFYFEQNLKEKRNVLRRPQGLNLFSGPPCVYLSSGEQRVGCCRSESADSQARWWSCNAIKGPPASLLAINGTQLSSSFSFSSSLSSHRTRNVGKSLVRLMTWPNKTCLCFLPVLPSLTLNAPLLSFFQHWDAFININHPTPQPNWGLVNLSVF